MSFAAKIWGAFAASNHNTRPGVTDMTTVAKMPIKSQSEPGTIHWLNECIERGKTGVFSEFAMLTPGLAGELLRRNPDNRSVRATKAAQYANDIRNGKWVFNGEPLIIADTGEMNDGQHRTLAVVDANLTIPMLFIFGVPRASRNTLDQGASRTASDYLGMDGVINATVQASIARLLIGYEKSDGTSFNLSRLVTNADVLARVYADEDVGVSAKFAALHAKATRQFGAPAVIGFCHYIFSEINPLEAQDYLTKVCRGEGLRAKEPAYTVRERLISLGTKSRDQRVHIIVRGWNAYRQGRQLTLAKIVGEENIPAVL